MAGLCGIVSMSVVGKCSTEILLLFPAPEFSFSVAFEGEKGHLFKLCIASGCKAPSYCNLQVYWRQVGFTEAITRGAHH